MPQFEEREEIERFTLHVKNGALQSVTKTAVSVVLKDGKEHSRKRDEVTIEPSELRSYIGDSVVAAKQFVLQAEERAEQAELRAREAEERAAASEQQLSALRASIRGLSSE